ncbi:MAG: bifunctional metallophosphatase/5'-nucleotidase [Erysipelotrichia bacterium]|jgi:2',3'-cyclic-nucleotide 2'-phosphodiesterase/3'-nucleotidase|nr:bifunctional metallophosphatase/5'-nucleotidase [Erysipelotrichia bacterium]
MKKKYLLLIPFLLFITSCDKDDNTTPSLKEQTPAPVLVDLHEENKEIAKDGDIVKIFHLNDTHGSIEHLPSVGEPGMSRIAGYINSKRQEEKTNVVLVSSGDMFQGSLDSNINKGRLMIDIMKEMKFDAMTIGNHEFDWGVDVLAESAAYAMKEEGSSWRFPFLAGNILNPENDYDFGYLSTTFNRGPARVGIIGATDSSVYKSIDANIVEGYKFDSQTKMVVEEAKRLRQNGTDLVIYSTHTGASSIDKKIIEEVDVVFTGHRHIDSVESQTNSKGKIIPIIESGSNGTLIGEVNFVYNASQNNFQVSTYQNIQLDKPYIIDEEVEAIYNTYLDAPVKDGIVEADSLRQLKNDPIGEITSDSEYVLNNKINVNNVRKMFLQAQLDRFKDSDGVIASFYNASRSEWSVGPITYSDIYKAFPFDNATIIVEADGQQLKKWSTAGVYLEGYTSANISSSEVYKVVTSTYIINNYEPYNYKRVVKEESELFQRHIFYEAFKNASGSNPWG